MNPFEALEIEPRFDLDRSALETRHRELSRALHPDRHAQAPAAERRRILGRAIEVNDAFRTLKDPVRRAEALLALRGVDVSETSGGEASPALLMEMMEQREALADARASEDADAVSRLGEAMQGRQTALLKKLSQALDSDAPDPDLAVAILGELRYVRRFLEEVATIEDALL